MGRAPTSKQAQRHLLIDPAGLVLSAGALAGAVLSVFALGHELLPNRPMRLAAVFEETRIGAGLPPSRHMPHDRAGEQRQRWPKGPALRRGSLVSVSFVAVARGYRDQTLDVCWSLYAVDPRRQRPAVWLSEGCASIVTPKADEERFSDDVTVPVPRGRGPWVVCLGIFRRGQRLDLARTRVFRGADVEPRRPQSWPGAGAGHGRHATTSDPAQVAAPPRPLDVQDLRGLGRDETGHASLHRFFELKAGALGSDY